MHRYTAEVLWSRDGQPFTDLRYSRKHRIRFDGGIEVAGSSSPQIVPLPFSAADAVDPEETFVASLSSCHMLWFLSIAAGRGLIVDDYRDQAQGLLSEAAGGKAWMSVVTLRPLVRFAGSRQPERAEVQEMHRLAHEECFIANSVRTEVRCEGRIEQAQGPTSET